MATTSRLKIAFWIVGAFAVASLFGSSAVLDSTGAGSSARLAIVSVPALATAVLAYLAVQIGRSKDEMFRRVQLEALAWAFPLAYVSLMTAGLITKALDSVSLDLFDGTAIMVVCYAVGYAIAYRRYA